MAALVDESKKIFVLPRLGTKKPYSGLPLIRTQKIP